MNSIKRFMGAALLVFLPAACTTEPLAIHFVLDEGEVGRPTVAVSPDGQTTYWAWFRRDADGWNVYASSFAVGGEADGAGADEAAGAGGAGAGRAGGEAAVATTPVRVNHIPGNASPHAQAPAQIVAGPDGLLYVAWTNSIKVEGRRFPASNLLVSVSRDGGQTFSPETAVNSDAGGEPSGHTFHNIGLLQDGTAVVSWIDGREKDRVQRELGLSDMDLLSGQATDHAAMHGAGMTLAQEDTLPGPQIRVAVSRDTGQTWTETAVVDHNSCPCCRTEMAVGPDGAVYLGWRHVFEDGSRDIVIARSDDGASSFGPPIRVHEDNWKIDACPHAGPALAVDSEGSLHVAWYTGVDGRSGVYHAVSTNRGQTYSEPRALQQNVPVTLVSLSGGASGSPTIAMERAIENQVVWRSGDDWTVQSPISLVNKAFPMIDGTLPSVSQAASTTALTWISPGRIEGLVRLR